MKGPKRFAASDPASDTSDVTFQNKRFIGGSTFDVTRPYQQQSTVMPPLDVNRAEFSRQHVRALNTQFASWVQKQLKDHPDELWEDGVRDYISHASKIMDKFSDVVNWLKANAMKERPAAESLSEKKLAPELNSSDNRLFRERSGVTSVSLNTSFTTSWSSSVMSKSPSSEGVFSGSQNINVLAGSQSSGLFSNAQSSGLFSNSQNSGLSSNGQASGLFSTNQSSGAVSNSQSLADLPNSNSSVLFSNSQSSGLSSNSQSSGAFSNRPNSGVFSTNQSSVAFSISQSLGGSSNAQSSSLFGLAGLSKVPTKQDTSDDAADNENELQQPSSPSVKKSEEKGIVVVHEVKCKLYVKSSDPADKDAWKDRGMGHLSIKCKEGVDKGAKESKPTIIVRNDVGKVLLNALLYPGIKTNLQKNSIVSIFHTMDDSSNDGSVVARTFLLRTKTEEDRNKLATAIQEYAPAS